jgi:hypothetical protein
MNLPSPVTIQPPSFTRSTGEVRTFKPITLTELDVTLIDNAKRKRCEARIRPCPQPLVLWTGAAYDAAGDYTQAQAESRILELLGPDIKAGLEALFVPPQRPAI